MMIPFVKQLPYLSGLEKVYARLCLCILVTRKLQDAWRRKAVRLDETHTDTHRSKDQTQNLLAEPLTHPTNVQKPKTKVNVHVPSVRTSGLTYIAALYLKSRSNGQISDPPTHTHILTHTEFPHRHHTLHNTNKRLQSQRSPSLELTRENTSHI